jgi:hypothetical protein
MALTLEQAQEMLSRYLTAEREVLEGKTISFGGRMMSMAELGDLREGRIEWERKVNNMTAAANGRYGPKLATFA